MPVENSSAPDSRWRAATAVRRRNRPVRAEEEIEYVEPEERRRDVMPQRRYLMNNRMTRTRTTVMPEPREQDTYREDPFWAAVAWRTQRGRCHTARCQSHAGR